MKGLIIGIVIIAVVIGIFAFSMNDEPNLGPKNVVSEKSTAKVTLSTRPASDLATMTGQTSAPASGLYIIARSSNNEKANAFSNDMLNSNPNTDS